MSLRSNPNRKMAILPILTAWLPGYYADRIETVVETFRVKLSPIPYSSRSFLADLELYNIWST
jgi:hypothetical protein